MEASPDLPTAARRPSIVSHGRKGSKTDFWLFDPTHLPGLTGQRSGFLPGNLGYTEIRGRHDELDGRRIAEWPREDVDRTVETDWFFDCRLH